MTEGTGVMTEGTGVMTAETDDDTNGAIVFSAPDHVALRVAQWPTLLVSKVGQADQAPHLPRDTPARTQRLSSRRRFAAGGPSLACLASR